VKRTAVNSQRRSSVRTWEKKLRASIAANQGPEAVELLKGFCSQISKAVKVGLVHDNNAARKIGRLSAQVAKISQ
jgi:small subunit ribosomal protein S20